MGELIEIQQPMKQKKRHRKRNLTLPTSPLRPRKNPKMTRMVQRDSMILNPPNQSTIQEFSHGSKRKTIRRLVRLAIIALALMSGIGQYTDLLAELDEEAQEADIKVIDYLDLLKISKKTLPTTNYYLISLSGLTSM